MKKIKAVFVVAAYLAAGHVGCGVVELGRMSQGSLAPKQSNFPALTAKEMQALQQGVKSILDSSNARTVLWGESDHCDLRQKGILADPQTLKILADDGFKQINIEALPEEQRQFDRVADGVQARVVTTGSTCGDSIGKRQDDLATKLIHNAKPLGIKIYAGDVGNDAWTIFWAGNALAMNVEAQEISYVNKTVANAWATAGMRWLEENRDDETLAAVFAVDHSSAGKSLIYRGDGHIKNDLPHSLRNLLPNSLALSFNGSPKDPFSEIGQSMCKSGEKAANAEGIPFRPTNYVIDLSTATVRKCVS